ncbi:MAG: hypothetical protein RMJ84_09970 [Sandaracinaceae bacterium]|nr:hypothetical protein [Sandaracinaceae bacterium]
MTSDRCAGPAGRTMRVLFVGNSQIDFWNLPRLVSSLSESANPSCPRIIGEKHTRGGANLDEIWRETNLRERIQNNRYDLVVLAESIDLVEHRPPFPELFFSVARQIVQVVRASGGEAMLYATPYVETPERRGFREMVEPQLQLGAELGLRVAAGGLAWLRAWQGMPSLDLYHEDRGHPGFVGSYLSGLVIWATIMGRSPVGLTNMPVTDCTDGPCTPISQELARYLQGVAEESWRLDGRP